MPYIEQILTALADGQISPDAATRATIAHDSWCGIFQGQPCNCEPTITFDQLKAEVVQ